MFHENMIPIMNSKPQTGLRRHSEEEPESQARDSGKCALSMLHDILWVRGGPHSDE